MSAQTPTTGQQTLSGRFAPEPDSLVDVSDADSNEELLLLVECPFCKRDWHDSFRRGEHSLFDVEQHILSAHARSIDHKRDDEHHSLGGQQ